MRLVGVYLIGVDLTGVHLMGVHLMGVHLKVLRGPIAPGTVARLFQRQLGFRRRHTWVAHISHRRSVLKI
jgi:hypothetical protein